MTPKFAKAVDRVFLAVLELLERIERNQPVDVQEERVQIINKIDHAQAMLGETEEWNYAKYALASWIDSMLTGAPWAGNAAWEERPLEIHYFRTRDHYTNYYQFAAKATGFQNKDALEVYYLCVVMGYRGMYGDNQGLHFAANWGLPTSMEEWARQTARSIQLGQGRPPVHERPQLGNGAPPLNGRGSLFGMAVFGVVFFGLALGYLVVQLMAS